MAEDRNITIFKWLEGTEATKDRVEKYLQNVSEWHQWEYKITANSDGSNICEAVAALANKKGGEVFVGISNITKKAEGTTFTSNRIRQYLSQPNAPPGIWYISDLNNVVKEMKEISVETGRYVLILEIQAQALPVFVYNKPKFILYIRQGDSTMKADSFEALSWNRNVNREWILKNCYLEFKTIVRRIASPYSGVSLGLGLNFPFLQKRMEDGTFYEYLRDKDILELLGQRTSGTSFSRGIYNTVFQLKFEIDVALRSHIYESADTMHRKIQAVVQSHEDYLNRHVAEFRTFLRQEKIVIDEE